MIVNKLFLNGNHTKNPNNSLTMARNVRFDDDFENLINEDGFHKLYSFPQNICGIIPTDVEMIVFCTDNNGDDYIYRVNEQTATLSLKGNLQFSTNSPITGVYQYNNKHDLIVCFNDTVNELRVFNFNSPYMDIDVNTKMFVDATIGLNKLKLIPEYKVPSISFDNKTPNNKGAMAKGTYHIVISYYINEYDRLNWTIPSLPYYVYKSTLERKWLFGRQNNDYSTRVEYKDYLQNPSETLSNNSVEFNVTNLDTQFKKYKLALIYRTDTSVKVYDMGDYDISTTYHNISSITTANPELSLDEVTVPYINFGTVNDITVSGDRLAVIGTDSDGVLDYQKYANNISVTYDIALNDNANKDGFYSITIKTPILDEVYALNIGLLGKDGLVKGTFHIPGRAPKPATYSDGGVPPSILGYEDRELTPQEKYFYNRSNGRTSGETLQIKYYYQLYNTAARVFDTPRDLGYWQNANEFYPDKDSSDIYNVDANGDPVYVDTLRNKNVRHHKMPDINKLYQILSTANSARNSITLNFRNIKFPKDIVKEIQGFFITYSNRDSANSTVLGYHPLIRNDFYEPANINANTANEDYYTIRQLRFNDYSLLYHKPALAKPYLRGVYTTDHNTHRQSPYYTNELYQSVSFVPNLVPIKDYNTEVRLINKYQYIPKDNSATTPNNRGREESLILHVNVPWDDTDDTLVCALKSDIDNVYAPFYNRRVSLASDISYVSDNIYSYELLNVSGFDGFISEYRDLLYIGDQTVSVNDDGLLTRDNSYVNKTKVLLAANCLNISTINTNARSMEEVNITLGPDPVEILSIGVGNGSWLNGLSYTGNIPSDPAKDFGITYDKQYSFTNSVVGYYVYDYNNIFVNNHPYRVARSAIQQKESLILNWRYFAAIDYYEMPKYRGVGKAIVGQDNMLLIHMEHSLFVARFKDRLSTPNGDAFIGQGDIFDRPPEELLPTSRGAAGIQSRFGHCIGEFGYMFADTYDQNLYVYSNNSLEVVTDDSVRGLYKKYMQPSSGNPLTGNDVILGIDHANKRIIITNLSTNFTMSYCYNGTSKGWVGMHDYIPAIMVNNRIGSYSVNRASLKDLYKFNDGDKGTYYNGVKYESYIDVLVNDNPKLDKTLNSVSLKSGKDNEANNIHKLFVHTRNQCSRIYDLSEFNVISDFDKLRYLGGFWNYDLIRDYTNNPIIQNIVDDFGNINPSSINVLKNWYELNPVSDRFIIVRLITNNSADMVFRDLEYNISVNRR